MNMILCDFAFLSLKRTGNSDVSILYTFLCNLVLYSNVTMSHENKNAVDDLNCVFSRSNVVTEDIGKLFVRRHAEPSSH
ncbi:hypothetical protein POTOM_000162 [Populus tomentosa]|uniref:Uncharacterized protein n=1 Tax=Populus tomentosa TaxID=118781 RepID=A0A8X8APT5_POPTO|nr:hypothetical protein POTOM_000162 [Populus tomentosa]